MPGVGHGEGIQWEQFLAPAALGWALLLGKGAGGGGTPGTWVGLM